MVSVGPKPLAITNYQGTPYDAAAAALTNAGFRVVERQPILQQGRQGSRPQSGSAFRSMARRATPSPSPDRSGSQLVSVPTVQRMPLPAARKMMREAGFKTKVQQVGVNRSGVRYVVYSNPGAQAQAPKGSTVILYVV